MAKRAEYQMVGVYKDGEDGKEVTGYHLQNLEAGTSRRYTREQTCFLVGKGQITNCSGQIYKDKVILRGEGMRIEELPVKKRDGSVRNSAYTGKTRRNDSATDIMNRLNIVAVIKKGGRNVVAYRLENAGGATNDFPREQVWSMAKQGRIGNARVQQHQGKTLLRGVGVNLQELPQLDAEELGYV